MNLLHSFIQLRSGLSSRGRNLWFRALGVHLNGYVWMRRISIPRQWGDITIEGGTALDEGVILLCSGDAKSDKLLIRQGSYINRYTMIDAHQRIEIGRNCMIGPQCYITDGNHGTVPQINISSQPMMTKPVILENDVWLGAGVIVLPGVRIGRGAVIGAGAVVTKDVPPDSIYVGVPARVVGQRATTKSVMM